jgi:DnaJ-class molecular chaperone
MAYNETEACRDWLRYNQRSYTQSLGCVNCGYAWFKHLDVCQTCEGTGSIINVHSEEIPCPMCNGTGRTSGKPHIQ